MSFYPAYQRDCDFVEMSGFYFDHPKDGSPVGPYTNKDDADRAHAEYYREYDRTAFASSGLDHY